jgi:hypothetical protein|tara:strand:- start:162 stop:359 length:198 start_codon:yes stop_codon:yes gene_type:complete
MQNITCSQYAKAYGLKSLKEVQELTGGVYRDTLLKWYKNKPELYEVIVLGCVAKKQIREKYGHKT